MKSVIIVAGGSGTRMNSPVPKQFLLLKEIPVLFYSLSAFFQFDATIRILIALPKELFGNWEELQRRFEIAIPHEVIPGGDTRFHSVLNCLHRLERDGLVAIHDGARPLVSQELIHRLFSAAEKNGNAIPVVPVQESIREVNGDSNQPADRSLFRIVQTPQVFHTPLIKQAYDQPYQPKFTDDATVFESTGKPIHLVEGDPANLKITYPADLLVAEALLR
jgi:2-C-methyl-D-erythritol 4-phosphate cytidylyltransferase